MRKRKTKAKPWGLRKDVVDAVCRVKNDTPKITHRQLAERFGISTSAVSDCLHDPTGAMRTPRRDVAKIRNITPDNAAGFLSAPEEVVNWFHERLSHMIGPDGHVAEVREASADMIYELSRVVEAVAGDIGDNRRHSADAPTDSGTS